MFLQKILMVLLPCLCHLCGPSPCTLGSVIIWRKPFPILRDEFYAAFQFYSFSNPCHPKNIVKRGMLSKHLLLPLQEELFPCTFTTLWGCREIAWSTSLRYGSQTPPQLCRFRCFGVELRNVHSKTSQVIPHYWFQNRYQEGPVPLLPCNCLIVICTPLSSQLQAC